MTSRDRAGPLAQEHHELRSLPAQAAWLPPPPKSSEAISNPAQTMSHRRGKPSLTIYPQSSLPSIDTILPHTGNTQASDFAGLFNHSNDTTELVSPRPNVTHDHDGEQGPTADPADDPAVHPAPLPLFFLILGISLAAFVVALDRTIVATAIPQITDDFHSPGDVGWFGSAYLLTSCAFQPSYGRVFAHFDVRASFIVALALFEVGSLICGIAQSAVMLIVGRAIAGLGCAGVFAGVMVIITLAVPLTKRPVYMGLVGSMYVSLASLRRPSEDVDLVTDLASVQYVVLSLAVLSPARRPGGGASTSTCPLVFSLS